jgi:hypothetical protein
MNIVSTTTPSQREANTIAFAQAASTMFAMDAMLSHEPRHLKMPRPGAYPLLPTTRRRRTPASQQLLPLPVGW